MVKHKHHYKMTFIKPPWWRRIFGAPSKLDHRCRICHKTINEVIAEFEVLLVAAEDRLLESLRLAKIHCGDDICDDDHP